mgnify:CR=1 FL=1
MKNFDSNLQSISQGNECHPTELIQRAKYLGQKLDDLTVSVADIGQSVQAVAPSEYDDKLLEWCLEGRFYIQHMIVRLKSWGERKWN